MAKTSRKKEKSVEKEPLAEETMNVSEPVKMEDEKSEVVESSVGVADKEDEKITEPIPIIKKEEPVVVVKPETAPVYVKSMDVTLSYGERILAFLETRRNGGYIRLNEFLKSLFPLPKPGEPARWMQQGENRFLAHTLETLRLNGELDVKDNAHTRLGDHYYNDDPEQKTQYHNLNTISIEAKS